MAGSLNKAMIIGNLAAKPELRYTQGGAAVTTLNIATNERWTDKSGETQEKTEWHRVTVFGRSAENCEKYLEKGRQVYVEGRIQTRKWQDNDGNDRYTTEIVANNVQFLSEGGDSGGYSGGTRGGSNNNSGGRDNYEQSFSDDDIPF